MRRIIPLRKNERIVSMRFLDPMPELNIDFYVNSLGDISERLPNVSRRHSSGYDVTEICKPSNLDKKELNIAYIK